MGLGVHHGERVERPRLEAGTTDTQVIRQEAQRLVELGHGDEPSGPGHPAELGQRASGIGQVVQRHRGPREVDGAEFDEPLRFLPDDLGVGRPGFETRALDALSVVHAEAVPTLGAPWASILGDAGWTVTGQHDLVIDEPSPEHPLAGRYARGWFDRLSHGLADRLDAEDRLTLTTLLGDGPLSLLRRTDLHLRGVRTVTVAHT